MLLLPHPRAETARGRRPHHADRSLEKAKAATGFAGIVGEECSIEQSPGRGGSPSILVITSPRSDSNEGGVAKASRVLLELPSAGR